MSTVGARVAVVEAPLALYRRYRPETFSEVIGQDHVTVPLRNALSNNRVNHAYLFSGPRGCGKTTSARILARAINCEKGPIAEPCGVCKSCTDLARGGPGSIDVIEIDAASHGGVDDARDLRERAFFAPVESRYKIYIIDEAHMVTTQGFNALLKLVEEPPPHLKFIFATTEPDKVIGTIRSRTHHYPFRLVPPKALADYMATLCEAEGVTIEPAALPLVIRAGAGSVRDSLSVLDQLIGGADADGVTYKLAVQLLGFTPDSLLDACVDGFAAHDSRAVFETIEKVIETGQDPKRFAEDLLRRLRDLVILSAVPNAVASGLIEAAEDQGERLQTQAAGIGAAELTRAADIVAAGLLEMRGATAPRLQLELICAKVLLPGADDSTNGIQARLDRMERRLTISGGAAGTAVAAAPSVQAASQADQPQAAVQSQAPAQAPVQASAQAHASAQGQAAGQAQGSDQSSATGQASGQAEAAGQPGGQRQPQASGQSAAQPVQAQAAPAAPAPVDNTGSRSGAWGDEPAPGSTPPPRAAAPAPSAPSTQAPPTAGASSGSVGLADVRRLWPEILEAVKAKRRFAWIMLSQNAQVIAIDEQTLTLGLVNAGARESFARSGSDEILQQAMIDTIGLNRRIEAVVDPSSDPGAAPPAAPPPPSTPPSSSWNSQPGTTDAPAAGPGAAPGADGWTGDNGSAVPGPNGASAGGAQGPAGGSAGAVATPGSVGGAGDGAHAGGLGGSAAGVGASEFGGAAGGPGGVAGGSGAAVAGSGGGANAGGPGGAVQTVGGAASGPAGAAGSGGAGTGTGVGGAAGGMNASGPSGTADAGGPGGAAGGGQGGASLGGSDGAAGGMNAGGASGAGSAGGSGAAASAGAAASGLPHAGGPEGAAGGAVGVAVQEAPAQAGQQAGGPPAPAADPQQVGVDRREQAASKRRAAEAAVAAEQAQRAAMAPVNEVPLSPEEEAEAIGEDDIVLEEDSRSHTDLLSETLGAQIISEEPN